MPLSNVNKRPELRLGGTLARISRTLNYVSMIIASRQVTETWRKTKRQREKLITPALLWRY